MKPIYIYRDIIPKNVAKLETTITGNVYPIEGEPTVIPFYWELFGINKGVDTYKSVQLNFAADGSSIFTFKVIPTPNSTVSLSVVDATYSLDGPAYKLGDTYSFSFNQLVNDFNLTAGTETAPNSIPLILKIDGIERRFLIYKYYGFL